MKNRRPEAASSPSRKRRRHINPYHVFLVPTTMVVFQTLRNPLLGFFPFSRLLISASSQLLRLTFPISLSLNEPELETERDFAVKSPDDPGTRLFSTICVVCVSFSNAELTNLRPASQRVSISRMSQFQQSNTQSFAGFWVSALMIKTRDEFPARMIVRNHYSTMLVFSSYFPVAARKQHSSMQGFRAKCRIATLVFFAIWVGFTSLYGLLKPVSNGCIMTYMYPTYVPIATPPNVSSEKYGLFLYHEGWKKIDFAEHLKKLSGVPVLFIPGNGGSFKQVRSLAAESDRAYQGGPLELTYYRDAYLTPEEGGNVSLEVTSDFLPLNQYTSMLDWFAVDLEGEHSAMDGGILEEHTEYVVYAVHRILDQYKESRDAQSKEGAVSGTLPQSVILVGHSMGGFVARAAVVHPHLRKLAVETILTLSSPHQSPPVALQPSLGHFFSQVNRAWRKGYEVQTTNTGRWVSDPPLSHVVVVSVSGGIHDYQVSSLDLGPWTLHNALSYLWWTMGSGTPYSFNWRREVQSPGHMSSRHGNNIAEDALEKDLFIHGTTITVLAMDGKRRWLDIRKLGANGKDHFTFVTNLAPCSGVRIHLWPEKSKVPLGEEFPSSRRIVEVTSKMVQVPAGPAPRQIEPGSQTEQAPPSAVLQLDPEDMNGFRFLTISVAPRPSVSGRPPPAASMAVGQFYNPYEGKKDFSSWSLLRSIYFQEELFLEEDHPLALNATFSVSLGLLPVTLSVKTATCGIKNSALPLEESGDMEHSSLCKLRCFPPIALAWDSISGLHVVPNLYSETIIVDSSPAFWGSTSGSEKTTVLLLVDPHCSYKINLSVSLTAAAGRFLLLYCSQIIGFSVAVIFSALMQQARAWELDLPLQSLLAAVESNLRVSLYFLLVAVVPLFASLIISLLTSQSLPPLASFIVISMLCYVFANGSMLILILCSQLIFYIAATVQVLIKLRLIKIVGFSALDQMENHCKLPCELVRILKSNPSLLVAVVCVSLVCFVHPALGLIILVLHHASLCHSALCRIDGSTTFESYFLFLATSFRSHIQRKESYNSQARGDQRSRHKSDESSDQLLPLDENYPIDLNSTKSFGDTQLEVFNYWHGMLILHLLAALMFVPSLTAWLQRIGMGQNFPRFLDSALCVGVILHGLYTWKPACSALSIPFPGLHSWEVGLSFIYLLASYCCYLSALLQAPYLSVYVMAIVGVASFMLRVIERRNREMGDAYFSSSGRKHSHRH
ncbi:hypothetical protein ACLOJK_015997 [Asimina triloba]